MKGEEAIAHTTLASDEKLVIEDVKAIVFNLK